MDLVLVENWGYQGVFPPGSNSIIEAQYEEVEEKSFRC